MQFAFTEEQELLRREAREALGNGGWSRDEVAGAELSFLDRAVLYEEAGRANVGEFLQTLPWQANAINRGTNNGGNGAIRVNLRGIGVESDEGVQLRVQPLDPRQECRQQFDR